MVVTMQHLKDLRGFVDAVYNDLIHLRKRVEFLEGMPIPTKKCNCDSRSMRSRKDEIVDQLPYVVDARDACDKPFPKPPEIFEQITPELPDTLGWKQVAHWWEKDNWKVWQTTAIGGMVWVYRKNNVGEYLKGANTLMNTVRMVEAIIDDT